MSQTKTLKARSLQLLAAVAIVLTLLGGVKLGADVTAAHATPAQVAPAQQLLACGGGADALPPCN